MIRVLLPFLILVTTQAATPGADWQRILAERLPEYGHRNWIVIADSAYPAQSKPGIETIVASADQMTVLREVLQVLSQAKHVRPNVLIDQELDYLDDKESLGIEAYRKQLTAAFNGRQVQKLPHEQIIKKLDQVSQTFRVLIIKSNMTLPYTSVFLQLDCAYWSPDAEKRLRERMAQSTK